MGQAIHKLTNNVNKSDKMNTPYKLLIIDDNKEILSALKDFFTRESYEVFSAADGLEGLKIAGNRATRFRSGHNRSRYAEHQRCRPHLNN
jgi:PleD family two-component response regulator